MSHAPDLSALTLPELRALNVAVGVAIAAAKAVAESGGGSFDCAILADAEGVSVTFTIPVTPETGNQTTNPQP